MDFSKQPDDSPKSTRTENRGTRVPAPDHVDPSMRDVNAEVEDPGSLPVREPQVGGVRGRTSTESTERRSDSTPTIPTARSSAKGPTSAGSSLTGSPSTGPVGDRPTPRDEAPWELRPHGLDSNRVLDRWNQVQSDFVDDPHTSIREADALAGEVTEAVIAALEEQRTALRATWDGARGGDTEALRLALRDYRSFVRHLNGDVN